MYQKKYPDCWLDDLKNQLAISLQDDTKDDILISYLRVCRKNLWTLFYNIPLMKNGEIPESHPWSKDEKTKLATLHLATTLVSNPDINLIGKDVQSNRLVMMIIGDRMDYTA